MSMTAAEAQKKAVNQYYLNNVYKDLRSRIDNTQAIIAPLYKDLKFPIAKGAYCTHNNKCYYAITEITSQEVWIPSHWKETGVFESVVDNYSIAELNGEKIVKSGKIVSLNSCFGLINIQTSSQNGNAYVCGGNLLDISNDAYYVVQGTFAEIVNRWLTDGRYTTGIRMLPDFSGFEYYSSKYITAVSPIAHGATYYFKSNSSIISLCVVDNNMNVLYSALPNRDESIFFTPPSNSAYVIVCYYNDATYIMLGLTREVEPFKGIFLMQNNESIIMHGGTSVIAFSPNGEDVTITATCCDSSANNVRHLLKTARRDANYDTDSHAVTLLYFGTPFGSGEIANRIIRKTLNLDKIDDMLCVGSATNGSPLVNWWPSKIMVCCGEGEALGNTTISQRSESYIEPFESIWGVTRQQGKTYYYKDYTSQQVRLIVLDVTLYESDVSEANAQTLWLENVLDDAISNQYHVIIATCAPRMGGTVVDCNFSSYPFNYISQVYQTPQEIIDAVASKISSGLIFVGYISNGEDKDIVINIANKQYMYCVSKVNDTHSNNPYGLCLDENHDAYNLFTVDTSNRIIKIIRGGGGDIDVHMRSRKTICIDYVTNTIISQG